MKRGFVFFRVVLIFMLLSGCVTPPTDPIALRAYQESDDPLEAFNRKILGFNMRTDKYILRPVNRAYRSITSTGFRQSLRVFIVNWGTPLTLVNDVLQLDFQGAGSALSRFTINTTLGFFGLFDVADRLGIKPHSQNFANTLGVWGVPPGYYLVLPVLGPSSVRDATAIMGDFLLDPLTYISYKNNANSLGAGLWVLEGTRVLSRYDGAVDLLDDLRNNSLDYYAATRAMYRQYRQAAIERALNKGLLDPEKRSYQFSLDDEE